MNTLGLEMFEILNANPGVTLQKFIEYLEQIKLSFQLTPIKTDGSSFEASRNDTKAMLLFKEGKDMITLFLSMFVKFLILIRILCQSKKLMMG